MTSNIAVPHAEIRGDGPETIVLLHGIGGSWQVSEFQLAEWSKKYRVVAWDMPGYGDSAALAEMTFEALAESLKALIDSIGAQHIILVGHSMGGMVAQTFVATYPERVTRLVLLSTSPSFGSDSAAGKKFREAFVAERIKPLDDGKTPADMAGGAMNNMVGDNPDPRGLQMAIDSMSRISSETYRQAVSCLATFDRSADLHRIGMPTLCICGQRDKVTPRGTVARMAMKIPRAQFILIEGAGHLPNIEQPKLFNSIVDSYLDETRV